MHEIIGVNGNIIELDGLDDEKKEKSLTYEISELLTDFGPMRRQLILQFFTEKHSAVVSGCLNTMLQIGKLYEIGGYLTTDQQFFEQKQSNVRFMDDLERKQKAFAVFLAFREDAGAERWWVNENQKNKWLILSFTAHDELLFVVTVEAFSDLLANGTMIDSHEMRNWLVLVDSDEDKEKVLSSKANGVFEFVSVNDNYEVFFEKNDKAVLYQ